MRNELIDELDGLVACGTLSYDAVGALSSTVVIAPHPDDECLGCGGLISLLAGHSQPVRIIIVSDGSGSHPHSKKFPPDALRRLREDETLAAAACLGVSAGHVSFLRLPDTRVPMESDIQFEEAVSSLASVLARIHPDTVLLPWRRDPHCDHVATWQIGQAAIHRTGISPRVFEYPVWIWDLESADKHPQPGEMRGLLLDIDPVIEKKQLAIASHRSQTTDLIDDDPSGFRISDIMLRRSARPWEIFLEAADGSA